MKPLLIALLLTASIAYAAEPTALKYPVVTKGRKVTFDEIQKSNLGKIMSLYLLPGRPKMLVGTGGIPDGALTQDKENKIYIWTGELHAILKDGLRLRWYFDAERTSSSEYGATKEDIDYILIQE